MIDLHSHILAGIDDGASCLADSIALINQSIATGVSKIIATPHIHFGTFDNNLHTIEQVFNPLCQEIQKAMMTVDIAFAAEVRICPEIILLVKNNKIPFLGKVNEKNALLLEFPHSHIIPGSEKLTAWLLANNIQPIIAHPERNRDLWLHPTLINDFVKQGCLLQITAASLLGDFGERSEQLAWQFLDLDIVHLIASDMHNIKRRPNRMADAFRLVAERFGEPLANKLCCDNAALIFATNNTVQSFKGPQ
jgi:protein-tyrosine phosphatase